MRIVHISDCYLPRLGGIEVQVRELARRQVAAGHEVHVITATPGHAGVFAGTEVLDGVVVHRVAAHLPFELPVHPRQGHHAARIISATSPDAVHVHAGVVSPFAWSGLRAATGAHAPTLVTVHSVWGRGATPGFRLSDAVLRWSRWGVQPSAVSEVAARPIREVLGPTPPVLVVPNGIDPDEWRVDPVPHDVDDVHVVAVMRLAPRKRTRPLLQALHAAAETVPVHVRLRATVVGDGPMRSQVERYLREQHLEGVVSLPGRLSHDQIRDLYAHADVFVQPSVKESFGLAALEARTAGLPVVARRETGITEFVRDGVEGLIVGSDEQMAEALARLATHAPLRQRIAAHNRDVLPDQVWAHVLEIVEDAYAQAAALIRPVG